MSSINKESKEFRDNPSISPMENFRPISPMEPEVTRCRLFTETKKGSIDPITDHIKSEAQELSSPITSAELNTFHQSGSHNIVARGIQQIDSILRRGGDPIAFNFGWELSTYTELDVHHRGHIDPAAIDRVGKYFLGEAQDGDYDRDEILELAEDFPELEIVD